MLLLQTAPSAEALARDNAGSKNGDNGDDDEQLDQGKPRLGRPLKHFLILVIKVAKGNCINLGVLRRMEEAWNDL
jgi:hypothetical protein